MYKALVTSRRRCRRGLFGKRLGTILHQDSPSTRYRIRRDNPKEGGERIKIIRIGYRIRRMRVDGSRIRKQKYPDTWERGLRHPVGPAYCGERAYCNSVFCEERDPRRLICFGFPLGIELCLAK